MVAAGKLIRTKTAFHLRLRRSIAFPSGEGGPLAVEEVPCESRIYCRKLVPLSELFAVIYDLRSKEPLSAASQQTFPIGEGSRLPAADDLNYGGGEDNSRENCFQPLADDLNSSG